MSPPALARARGCRTHRTVIYAFMTGILGVIGRGIYALGLGRTTSGNAV